MEVTIRKFLPLRLCGNASPSWGRWAGTLLLFCLALIPAQADIRLTIRATRPTLREAVVVYQTTVLPIRLDETGCGSLTLTDLPAVHAKLFYGQVSREFFMEDGDSLVFTFDGNDFAGTLAQQGGKSRIFRYLNTITLPVPDESAYAKPFVEYKQLVEGKEREAQKLFVAWHLERLSPRFAEIERGRIHYGYAQNLMMYAAAYPLLTHQENWTPTAEYLTAVRAEAVERPELRNLFGYREYMKEAARLLDSTQVRGLPLYDRTLRQMQWFADHLQNDTLRETLINTLAVEYVEQAGIDSIAELRNLQGAYVTLPHLTRAFDRAVQARDLIAPGHSSPVLSATGLDGGEVTLEHFKGKYVYIDLWATWCAPCRKEFPYLKQLEQEFAGRNIVFLGLSTDSDTAAWRKMAATLGGVQAHIGEGSAFARAYRVDGIPRFILLDREGCILNADMTRPSAPETAAALRALTGI